MRAVRTDPPPPSEGAQAAGPAPASGSRRLAALGALVLLLASGVLSLVLLWPQLGTTLNWDEVDYLNAARQGVAANLLERGSLPIPTYLHFARSKITHTDYPLPPSYDEANDPIHLRHGHSPGVVVGMVPTANTHSERSQRAIQAVGAVVLTVALAIAYLIVTPRRTWLGLLAIAAIGPWYGWHLFRFVEFHGWEAVWVTATAVCLSQWLRTGRRPAWGVAVCASLALCVLTLESGAFVVLGALVCLVVWVRGLGRRTSGRWIRRYALPGLALSLAMVAVAWPGFLLKGSLFKIPLERVYQVVFSSSDIFYLNGKASDPLTFVVPALVILAGCGYLFLKRRDEAAQWGPFVVIGVVYFLGVIKFSVNETYYYPAVAPFIVLLAVALSSLPRRAEVATAVVLAALVVASSASIHRLNQDDVAADNVRRADYAFLGGYLQGKDAWLDGGHVFRHYVPGARIQTVSYNASGLAQRRAGKYETIPPSEYAGKVFGILSTRGAFLRSETARTLTAMCARTDRPTVILWDCR